MGAHHGGPLGKQGGPLRQGGGSHEAVGRPPSLLLHTLVTGGAHTGCLARQGGPPTPGSVPRLMRGRRGAGAGGERHICSARGVPTLRAEPHFTMTTRKWPSQSWPCPEGPRGGEGVARQHRGGTTAQQTQRYLHAVRVAQERRLLHPEVVGDQGVEAIGEIQDLGVAAALGQGLGEGQTEHRLRQPARPRGVLVSAQPSCWRHSPATRDLQPQTLRLSTQPPTASFVQEPWGTDPRRELWCLGAGLMGIAVKSFQPSVCSENFP